MLYCTSELCHIKAVIAMSRVEELKMDLVKVLRVNTLAPKHSKSTEIHTATVSDVKVPIKML